ncbi:hypothetical protein G3573_20610, partial [Caulobacter sp. 17J65-9]|nr:hypothetical protein [Caulobacter sp. 17J65-9]
MRAARALMLAGVLGGATLEAAPAGAALPQAGTALDGDPLAPAPADLIAAAMFRGDPALL